MNKIFLFFKKTEKTIVIFSKRCSKKRVWAFEKTTENVSAPFFEKVRQKDFLRM